MDSVNDVCDLGPVVDVEAVAQDIGSKLRRSIDLCASESARLRRTTGVKLAQLPFWSLSSRKLDAAAKAAEILNSPMVRDATRLLDSAPIDRAARMVNDPSVV